MIFLNVLRSFFQISCDDSRQLSNFWGAPTLLLQDFGGLWPECDGHYGGGRCAARGDPTERQKGWCVDQQFFQDHLYPRDYDKPHILVMIKLCTNHMFDGEYPIFVGFAWMTILYIIYVGWIEYSYGMVIFIIYEYIKFNRLIHRHPKIIPCLSHRCSSESQCSSCCCCCLCSP